eukprot:scaffold606786_cov45-Prasinocladus_malaysianus.AAC.1
MNALTGVAAFIVACVYIPQWGGCNENMGLWLLIQVGLSATFMTVTSATVWQLKLVCGPYMRRL